MTENLAKLFLDPGLPTLRDVLDRLEDADGPGHARKREMASAIRSFARWSHRGPEEIPAHPDYLRRAFARLNFATLGVGRRRFDNARSLISKSLEVAGATTTRSTWLAPLNPAWRGLWEAIPDPYARSCLRRFMGYASAKAVDPEDVDDELVKRLFEALTEENLTSRPIVAVQSAVRLWNRMVDAVPGWPARRLTPIRRAERHALCWDQLPPEFVAEVERYLAIQGGEDPIDALAPPRPLRPLSVRSRRRQILWLASGFVNQGGDVTELRSLADLCELGRVRVALRDHIERRRARLGPDADVATSMIGGLADTARCIAKHHLHAPEAQIAELSRITARLNRRRPGMTEKNRSRLRQTNSPEVLGKLLSHPRLEMRRLAAIGRPTRRDAVRYAVLLAIEILILAPMRIANLAALDLDQHFRWPDRSDGDIGVSIPRGSVKNRLSLDYVVPAASAAYLHVYVERFRPLLKPGNGRALFPGTRGRARRADTLSKQVSRELRGKCGIAWHPHLFRHLAARLNLAANAGDYEGTRRLLGHRSAETTYQIYEGMEMRPAVERYDQLIEATRGPDAPLPGPRGGRRRRTPSQHA